MSCCSCVSAISTKPMARMPKRWPAKLEITLTGRDDKGTGARISMAGVPHHALERYVARLIAKSYKVAVCDQVEDPKLAKGLVKRKVTRVLTPGTIVEDAMLDAKTNNYLVAAITGDKAPSGVGVVDVSTGEFLATEIGLRDGHGQSRGRSDASRSRRVPAAARHGRPG